MLVTKSNILWLPFKTRINLSPFTKDFRGEEQLMSLNRLIFETPNHFLIGQVIETINKSAKTY